MFSCPERHPGHSDRWPRSHGASAAAIRGRVAARRPAAAGPDRPNRFGSVHRDQPPRTAARCPPRKVAMPPAARRTGGRDGSRPLFTSIQVIGWPHLAVPDACGTAMAGAPAAAAVRVDGAFRRRQVGVLAVQVVAQAFQRIGSPRTPQQAAPSRSAANGGHCAEQAAAGRSSAGYAGHRTW